MGISGPLGLTLISPEALHTSFAPWTAGVFGFVFPESEGFSLDTCEYSSSEILPFFLLPNSLCVAG